MTKKKSKAARTGKKSARRGNNLANDNAVNTTRKSKGPEAFEEVLRKYAHPAAVADLDALPRGSKSWQTFLESLGSSCRDNSLTWTQQASVNNIPRKSFGKVDKNCPIVRAMIERCGPKVVGLLTDDVYENLKRWLPSYGRPVQSKFEVLVEHQMQVAHAEKAYEPKGNKTILRNTTSTVRKKVSLHTTKMDWSRLTRVSIRDLKLYEAHEGQYIEGKLLVEPHTPMVGTTTILEDSNGDVILVTLYNFLPDGLHGRESIPIASGKIPKGCTIRIAEPFQKIFRDGSRGIRIDNPSEISVISEDEPNVAKKEESLLCRAKLSGNEFVQKRMYNAASEAYINGMRKAELAPTLLSNRSQAYAMVGDWERSFADAAASLTMRPFNEKTWSRYQKALEMLSEGIKEDISEQERARQMMRRILLLEPDDQAAEPDMENKDEFDLKAEGNAAFKKKQYSKAAAIYTNALMGFAETSRALLANWALCCLNSGSSLDAVASSAASLRIRPEAKAVVRLARGLLNLGESELCQEVLQEGSLIQIPEGSDAFCEKRNLLQSVASASVNLQTEGMQNHLHVLTQKYLPRWVGDVESFDAGAKGRGVRATKNLKAGQLVLIEPPLAIAETDGLTGKRKDSLMSFDNLHDIKDPSQAYLRQSVVLRSQREQLLSQVVNCLSDGANKRLLSSLEDLMPNISSCRLLLPTHYEYMQGEKVELTADRVDAIVSVNSHGKGGGKKFADRFAGINRTSLFAATSMFNHSSHPTCEHGNVGGCSVMLVVTDVKEGKELTVCYHPDKEVVRRNWGIAL